MRMYFLWIPSNQTQESQESEGIQESEKSTIHSMLPGPLNSLDSLNSLGSLHSRTLLNPGLKTGDAVLLRLGERTVLSDGPRALCNITLEPCQVRKEAALRGQLYVPQVSRGPTLLAMQYQVLARKWRPQNFHELVGQEHISRTLLNALRSGRVAHAFLFSGPRGSGKTTTARVLAKALNCHAGQPGQPCGKCPACVEIAEGNSMDVLEIDAASNRGIDEIRELREKVRYSPARDKHKIFIIDEVHMLTAEAFNALLKTLEEPPPRVIFILATTEYHKIPATILSRCQQHNFKLIPYSLVLHRLSEVAGAENIRISTRALEQIAYSSGGSLRDAMSALDQVIAFSGEDVRDEDVTMLLGLVEPAILKQAVTAVARHDTDRILDVVRSLVEAGQDLQNFTRRLLGHFRNLMILKSGVTDLPALGIPESLAPELREQSELFSREDLLRLFDALLQTETDLKYATQIRFQLEMGLIKLAEISRLRPFEDLVADFTALVKSEAPSSGAAPDRAFSAATSPPSGVEEQPGPTRKITMPPKPAVTSPPRDSVPAHPDQGAPEAHPAGPGSRELLERIAGALKKESLAPILCEVPKAEPHGDTLELDLGSLSEFHRRQIKENIGLIAEAASTVLGRNVKVTIGKEPAAPAREGNPSVARADPGVKTDILERAKREPVIQSFLDTFPGPIKAEDLD